MRVPVVGETYVCKDTQSEMEWLIEPNEFQSNDRYILLNVDNGFVELLNVRLQKYNCIEVTAFRDCFISEFDLRMKKLMVLIKK